MLLGKFTDSTKEGKVIIFRYLLAFV